MKPTNTLTVSEGLAFWAGFSLFRDPWVAAPASTLGRDGLGPLFNARSCDACHHNGAQGDLPEYGLGAVVRLGEISESGEGSNNIYGEQLQTLSIDSLTGGNEIPAEAKWAIRWQPVTLTISERAFELKKPLLAFSDFAYGHVDTSVAQSLRLAPPLFGLGDIDTLSDAEILSGEDPQDSNADGISGRANRVLDRQTGKMTLGRFGYKAEQPNLRQQIAGAFFQDIGISSWLYPQQNCSPVQTACLTAVTGNSSAEKTEISREKLELVTAFSRELKAANGTEKNARGEALFSALGCSGCHQTFKRAAIYSDLLLHDMGPGLADNRPVYKASGDEWRTTPLRGLNRKLMQQPVQLLHDGRAATLTEALLWHGGEAAKVRKNFVELTSAQQAELIEFLRAL
ncbi:di-heme oxidoredictase family protein [Teredinibacter haidensis]|uniref:di-heme oxidoredictase family protein n=1 Tax=Teredinibacter haidensis TaxID=2731755 RepID=UPI000948EB09|nr:di-heme oxidoredictase family protein [Teredinibacter haidensis]